ncbi:MAG: prolipoprotein diacylglyceryl transferase [Clostridiales bacterium]|nr:prolipoprotein diacylglyceryl transferase [Clostridiales bacterium]
MSNYTTVYFKAIEKSFNVASTLCEFDVFGVHFTIQWYGVIIAFGFTLAALLGGRIAWTWRINLNKMVDILIYGSFAGIIGARLYYVFQRWDYYGKNLSEIPKIWEGGLGIYGGIICGLLCAYFVCKIEKVNFLNLLDMACISIMLGQAIGRWGNFTNQEAFGTNTDLPWGMWSQKIADDISSPSRQAFFAEHNITIDPLKPVHPTFLYESLWCLFGVFILWLIIRKFRLFSGQTALWYGVWYGIERTIIEGLRTDSLYLGSTNLRTSQILSFIIFVICSAVLVTLTLKYKKNPKPIEGIDFFPEGSRHVKNN